jgi:hypothetical protein
MAVSADPTYDRTMARRWVLLASVAIIAGPQLCSCSSGPESCVGYCEPGSATGPQIVAAGTESIAAIETTAECGGTADVCGVDWTGRGPVRIGASDPTAAPTVDAAGTAGLCARRYTCPQPPPAPFDGALVAEVRCWYAWLNLRTDHCSATIIAMTGERQSFEATRGSCTTYRCKTGTGECVTSGGCSAYPSTISVTFAAVPSADSGTAMDASLSFQ